MKQKPIESNNNHKSSQRISQDMIWFIIVMIVFTMGMALLLFYDVSAWWIWYIYFVIWTLVEYKIAKNIKLKWWHWLIIITVIISIDWIVLELIDYIKN